MDMGVELYHGYAGQRITDAGVIRTRSRVKGLRIRDRTCLVNIITVRYTYIVNIITVRVVGHGYATWTNFENLCQYINIYVLAFCSLIKRMLDTVLNFVTDE
jgi:hypothetical protein